MGGPPKECRRGRRSKSVEESRGGLSCTRISIISPDELPNPPRPPLRSRPGRRRRQPQQRPRRGQAPYHGPGPPEICQRVEEQRPDEEGSAGPGPRVHVDEGPLPDAAAARHGRGEAQDGELAAQGGPLPDDGAPADGGRGAEVRSLGRSLPMRERERRVSSNPRAVTSLNCFSTLDRKSHSQIDLGLAGPSFSHFIFGSSMEKR